MGYFEHEKSKLTFSRSFGGLRRHLFKCILILLIVTIVLFTVISYLTDWYTVTLRCVTSRWNHTDDIINMHQLRFGVNTVCGGGNIENRTDIEAVCVNSASLGFTESLRE